MKIQRITNPSEIYTNDEISKLLGMSVFGATPGKIRNIAQSAYKKQQGRFYVLKEDEKIIGILGMKEINNERLDILHIAILEEYRGKKYSKLMMEEVCELENIQEMTAQATYKTKEFYKKSGFSVNLFEDNATGQEFYMCSKFFHN